MSRKNYIISIVNAHRIHYEARLQNENNALHKLVEATRFDIPDRCRKFTIVMLMKVVVYVVIKSKV